MKLGGLARFHNMKKTENNEASDDDSNEANPKKRDKRTSVHNAEVILTGDEMN